MRIVKLNGESLHRLVCNEDVSAEGDGSVTCEGVQFKIVLSAAGTRLLECIDCGYKHEVEQMMPGFVEGDEP